MDSYEIKQIQQYLNKKFFTEYYEIKEDNNNSNSAEVYFKKEFRMIKSEK